MELDPELYDEDEDYYWLKEYGRWSARSTIGWSDDSVKYTPCCRTPRSTQERRANQDVHGEPRMWRGSRGAKVLPNAWNDQFVQIPNSWKKKRKRRFQWQRR